MRILVAEDDPVSRRVLARTLEKWGYDVATACDGVEAWNVFQHDESPELAIIDWMMPRMDGVELCRKIRQRKGQRFVYIIMLTAKAETGDLVRAMDAGADDFITKADDTRELSARLRAAGRIVELEEALRQTSTHDALTELWNHGAILDILRRELSRVQRTGGSVGVVMVDIDHFKRLNDKHGHTAGDAGLREMARIVSSKLRAYDSIGRYGGDEFLVVLPGAAASDAAAIGERIRQWVSGKPLMVEGEPLAITVSCGVALACNEQHLDAGLLVRAADAALYQAKEAGRDRVVVGSPSRLAPVP